MHDDVGVERIDGFLDCDAVGNIELMIPDNVRLFGNIFELQFLVSGGDDEIDARLIEKRPKHMLPQKPVRAGQKNCFALAAFHK